MMEVVKKTITINNRELMRHYKLYREKLLHGEVDCVVIPMNGKKLSLTLLKEKAHRPGDIRPLLEKLKAMGPKRRISLIRMDGEVRSLDLMKRLSKKRSQ
jgi:hypothetical protein